VVRCKQHISTRRRDNGQEFAQTVSLRISQNICAAALNHFTISHKNNLIDGMTRKTEQMGDEKNANIFAT